VPRPPAAPAPAGRWWSPASPGSTPWPQRQRHGSTGGWGF
jgi:hypothetical protein